MPRTERFAPEDRRHLTKALKAGEELVCPRCQGGLDRREVRPRADVSYVRDRVWVTCPTCHLSTVLDHREPL